jgi:hypothetical protein
MAMSELSDYELMNTFVEQTGFPIQVAILARACFYSYSSRALLSRSLYRKLAVSKGHLRNGPQLQPLQVFGCVISVLLSGKR